MAIFCPAESQIVNILSFVGHMALDWKLINCAHVAETAAIDNVATNGPGLFPMRYYLMDTEIQVSSNFHVS